MLAINHSSHMSVSVASEYHAEPPTLHSVLCSESADASESSNHKVLKHLVALLSGLRSVVLEGRNGRGVWLIARTAVER